ncbi:TfoX/Sxy family protein [Kineococcus sp. LSe6-4]|uniref:TfoX/Sxy family protein n=1 Tax=Kineococcus halophytocola TaxID=3234027 RepID=A0ABV4H0F1_9ACTN
MRTLERVRDLLAGRDVRERRMFGGTSVVVDGRMVLSVRGDGTLLVRVDPDRSADLVAHEGAVRAEMGAGRDMGPSWLSVPASDGRVEFWVAVALEHHGAQAG